ncbi:hypothetical protein BD309DRAFT_609705 [Dichomitus squalens]|nr:hypothetical protein BD309DRAFT_609705 [Dichomitus squalens]
MIVRMCSLLRQHQPYFLTCLAVACPLPQTSPARLQPIIEMSMRQGHHVEYLGAGTVIALCGHMVKSSSALRFVR